MAPTGSLVEHTVLQHALLAFFARANVPTMVQQPVNGTERAKEAANLLHEALQLLDNVDPVALEAEAPGTLDAVLQAVGDLARGTDALNARMAEALEKKTTVDGEQVTIAYKIGYRSPLDAMQFTTGSAAADARAAIDIPRHAEALGLEKVTASFRNGQISLAQLRSICRPVQRDQQWLDDEAISTIDDAADRFATGSHGTASAPTHPATPEELGRLVRNWVMSQSSKDPEVIGDRRRARRYLRASISRDQLLSVHARIPLEEGGQDLLNALVAARLDTRAEGDTRTQEQRESDLFTGMIRTAVRYDTRLPKLHGAPPSATVSVTAEVLSAYADADLDIPAQLRPNRGHATLVDSQEPVAVNVAARFICDGEVQAVVSDETTGMPLRLGRKKRLFSQAQRRALIERDGGCAVPGCSMPPGWCEAHHIRTWADGGATDIDNGILLCNFHHHEVHRARLRIRRSESGRWRIDADSV